MSEIRDFFIKSLDEAESGIGHLMTRLMNEVEARDSSINLYFKEMKLLPQYYSFRLVNTFTIMNNFHLYNDCFFFVGG